MRPAKFLMASLVAVGALAFAGAADAKPLQLSDAQMDGVTAGFWLPVPVVYPNIPCVYPPPPPPCPVPYPGFRITVSVR